MGLNGTQAFGTRFGLTGNGNVAGKSQKDERPKADFWLNIGYPGQIVNDEGETENRFIALASGIALDTMEDLEVKGSSLVFRQQQAARNSLRDQIIAKAATLEPGEEELFEITGTGGLHMQLRRVSAPQAAIKATENPLVRKLAFA